VSPVVACHKIVFETMGVLDESSDEDHDDVPKSSAPLHHSLSVAGEEEEDPLDAYMKSLEDKEESPSKSNAADGRFDSDEEEEEHGFALSAERTLPFESDDDHDEIQASQEQMLAKQALESTFRKTSRRENEDFTTPQFLSNPSTTPFLSKFWDGEDTIVGRNWRRDHEVTLRSISNRKKSGIGSATTEIAVPTMDPILRFEQLNTLFGTSLSQQIATQNYTVPTLVQSQTLPIALSGRDCLVTAATGQGKTLAYVWPICVHLMHQLPLQRDETGPLALVLVPTRELALQVQKQAKPMLDAAQTVGNPLRCRAVIGGQGKYMLLQELKKTGGIELVIATPGRLLDVVSDTKGLSLKRVTFLVLDEADKMLHMGFEQQVNLILQQIRPDRQTLMLSATMGLRVEKVACEWLQPSQAVRISIGRTGQASQNVEQHIMVLPDESAKEVFLVEMLPTFNEVGRCIVFVSTRVKCEKLADLIRARAPDVPVLTLHGDKHQSDRTAAVRKFSKGSVKILIATDVAARGLDIPNVQTVLSFDPAKDLDSHVHRLGRAGRLSKETNEQTSGCAYTLLVEANADFAHILLGALEREGKAASPDLVALANKSRRKSQNPSVNARSVMSKAGLGYESSPPRASRSNTSGGAMVDRIESCANAMVEAAPLPKRTRWT
jgi:ATP-dependent RNA helicase DDX42